MSAAAAAAACASLPLLLPTGAMPSGPIALSGRRRAPGPRAGAPPPAPAPWARAGGSALEFTDLQGVFLAFGGNAWQPF